MDIRKNEDGNTVVTVTVNDLIAEANAAMARMANTNPNKRLLYTLGSALSSLSDRYTELAERYKLEEEARAQASR